MAGSGSGGGGGARSPESSESYTYETASEERDEKESANTKGRGRTPTPTRSSPPRHRRSWEISDGESLSPEQVVEGNHNKERLRKDGESKRKSSRDRHQRGRQPDWQFGAPLQINRNKQEVQKEKDKETGEDREGGYNNDKPNIKQKPPTLSTGVKCLVCGKWVKDENGLAMHQRSSVRCASRRGEESREPCPRCGKHIAKGQYSLEQHWENGCRANKWGQKQDQEPEATVRGPVPQQDQQVPDRSRSPLRRRAMQSSAPASAASAPRLVPADQVDEQDYQDNGQRQGKKSEGQLQPSDGDSGGAHGGAGGTRFHHEQHVQLHVGASVGAGLALAPWRRGHPLMVQPHGRQNYHQMQNQPFGNDGGAGRFGSVPPQPEASAARLSAFFGSLSDMLDPYYITVDPQKIQQSATALMYSTDLLSRNWKSKRLP